MYRIILRSVSLQKFHQNYEGILVVDCISNVYVSEITTAIVVIRKYLLKRIRCSNDGVVYLLSDQYLVLN